MSPEDRFDEIAGQMLTVEGVWQDSGGRRLGAPALRYQGRLIAMLSHGRLVVKLPRRRVDELVSEGTGLRYYSGNGTPMRQWFVLDPWSPLPWLGLAKEALAWAQRPG